MRRSLLVLSLALTVALVVAPAAFGHDGGQGTWGEPAALKQITGKLVSLGLIIEMLRFAKQSRCLTGGGAIAEVAQLVRNHCRDLLGLKYLQERGGQKNGAIRPRVCGSAG